MTVTPITLNDLTVATLGGTGVFDVLMRANKAHLEAEFKQNRITGPEYATVYLGSLESVLAASVAFLLQKDKHLLEAQLLEQQILIAQQEVLKATAAVAQVTAQTALIQQQTLNAVAELAIIQANALKVPAEIDVLEAQALMIGQQRLNAVAEGLNIPKQGEVLDAQVGQITQQTANLVTQGLQIAQQTLLLTQQTANAVIEGTVLTGQKCKLDAEYDLLLTTNLKTDQEKTLLLWKTNTEKAQTIALGVDADSVIGRQKELYVAQSGGFTRDAEQKAAKIMVDSWNVRRTTDDATEANSSNLLYDSGVGRAVGKLLAGVGA